jgi:hypothetical protein
MVDYSDNELDSKIEGMLSPNCHPTHFNMTADFEKIVGKSNEEKEALNLPRYYASELLGIKSKEVLPLNVLAKNKDIMTEEDKERFADLGNKIAILIKTDDNCDMNGIKFIATLFKHYNDVKGQAGSSNIQKYISSIFSYNAKIIDLAKEAIK